MGKKIAVKRCCIDEGSSFKEIGEKMGMPASSVNNVYLRIMAKFLRAFAPDLGPDDVQRLVKTPQMQKAIKDIVIKAIDSRESKPPRVKILRLIPTRGRGAESDLDLKKP
jgi:hypothetical protein